MKIEISKITRHPDLVYRQDLSGAAIIAKSMARPHGQLHAIGVDAEYRLIWGALRVEGAKLLGWAEIEATVVDLADPLAALRDENDARSDMSPSEKVALGRAIEASEAEKAKVRQRESRAKPGQQIGGEKFPPPKKTKENEEKGKAADKAAEAVGMSRPTYEKAKKIVEAAEADPTLKPIVEEMDVTGKVSPAHAKLKIATAEIGPTDANGRPWVGTAAPKAASAAPKLKEFSRRIANIIAELQGDDNLALYSYSQQSVIATLKAAKETLLGAVPAYICPYCDGTLKTLEGSRHGRSCDVCNFEGWVTASTYQRSPKGGRS